MGATSELARIAAGYLDSYVLLDIIEIADQQQMPTGEVADLYHYVSDQFRVDYLLTRVSLLPRHGHWDRLSRTAQREDLYAVLSALTRKVAATRPTARGEGPTAVFEQWRADTTHLSARTQKTIADVCLDQRPTLAAISVAVRSLRALTQAA
jgi:glutamate dehydrogenase